MIAVQVAHHRLQRNDGLTRQRHRHAENAMGRGVLRSHIDHHNVGVDIRALLLDRALQALIQHGVFILHPAIGIEIRRVSDIIGEGIFIFRPVDVPFRPAALERLGFFFKERFLPVLAQWMTFKTFPQQDPAQIRMSFEADSQQVPGFAFLQICAWEYRHQEGTTALSRGNWALKTSPGPPVVLKR